MIDRVPGSDDGPLDDWAEDRAVIIEQAYQRANGAAAKPPFAGPIVPAAFPLIRVRDIADPGPVKWLIDQLWTVDAFGIVGAEPKSWKSWLTLYLGICVASGRPAFNRFEVEQGTVAMFSAEGGNGLLRQRAALLCNAMDIEIPDDLFALDVPTLRIDQAEVAARILVTVQKVRPRLLILDPLRELHQGDENDAADIARLLDPLRSLQREGCACMLVHHLGKLSDAGRRKGGQRGGQRLRGSSALHGAVDSALYLETTGEGDAKRVTVQAEHRSAAEPAPFTLRLHHRSLEEKLWLEIVSERDEQIEKATDTVEKETADQLAKRAQILRAVAAATLPGRTPLASKVGIYRIVKGTKGVVLGLIQDLLDEQLLVLVSGQFHLTEAGRDLVALLGKGRR